MGSKGGRIPPPHLRRPLPEPGMVHHDPFGAGIRPPPGPYPPFDLLPPPEVMEQKLNAQHMDMQRLATENQRLSATHVSLRQELAAAQHELQMLHAHIGALKSERDQQMRALVDKIGKMEAELKAAEPVRLELQKARAEAENLVAARQELMSKMHQLTQDLNRAHAEVQQIPPLLSELDGLKQEYEQCRFSYDYEKKLFNDHRESLQAMEKNYVTMAREVEKLRSQLTNATNVDIRTVGGPPYGAIANNENEASGRPGAQNIHEDGYVVPQVQGNPALPANAAGASAANSGMPSNMSVVTPSFLGAQSGSGPRGPGYDAPRGPSYDAQRGHNYDAQRGPSYDGQRGPGYDTQRLPGFDIQRGPGYDAQRPNFDANWAASYDALSRGVAALHGQLAPVNNIPYVPASATPPPRTGSLYEAPARGGNPGRR